ncbi:MAG: sigma factor [Acutalibacteraceae bacterium]|nr:sigma factor [Acutalibacteraceae bacterium]
MKKTSVRSVDDIEAIINKYGDMLYRLCFIMLKNQSDAEDIVQEQLSNTIRKHQSLKITNMRKLG